MKFTSALVITSIFPECQAIKIYAQEAQNNGYHFIVIGDKKSPDNFSLQGCDHYSLEQQKELSFDFAKHCPEGHYARKNIGYLIAIQKGYQTIVETDDDNFPLEEFWDQRAQEQSASTIDHGHWVNVYRYFSDKNIWPRGFALDQIQQDPPAITETTQNVLCPIQQGLANANPDIDAIYRMTMPLPLYFEELSSIALGKNSWCPFNSQNTTWFKEAFPLMYLPSYCSFRMTDIWRSFVAQRIAWSCGWHVLFHNASVYQERNEHNLLRDFEEEIPGYLNNGQMCQALQDLELKPGSENLHDNLRTCYKLLVDQGWVGKEELDLLDHWLNDLTKL